MANKLASSFSDTQSQINLQKKTEQEDIARFESAELILGLSAPIGADITKTQTLLTSILKDHGYESVYEIKISTLIMFYTKTSIAGLNEYDRFRTLQKAGNELRKKHSKGALASLAIEAIKLIREVNSESTEMSGPNPEPTKVAYIINQLKHPAEIEVLRSLFGNLFYLIGVLSNEDNRFNQLHLNKKIPKPDVAELIKIDKSEKNKFGQQLAKTLEHADMFVTSDGTNEDRLRGNLQRFIKLIHGDNFATPTQDELGMYSAYSAALSSSCLSRQVGASIVDETGLLLATGCNDVPNFGGGIYSSTSQNDNRCFARPEKICHNNKQKNNILNGIKKSLKESLPKLSPETLSQIIEKIKDDTRITDLLEFSRSIHAEMDALISLVRNNRRGVQTSTLYSTTYPCHNCARHIVAAGIKKVLFIEPYEKSMATILHDDSISNTQDKTRVQFLHFEGVAPRKYQSLFRIQGNRKNNDGEIHEPNLKLAKKVIPEYTISYLEKEDTVVKHIKEVYEITDSIPPDRLTKLA